MDWGAILTLVALVAAGVYFIAQNTAKVAAAIERLTKMDEDHERRLSALERWRQ